MIYKNLGGMVERFETLKVDDDLLAKVALACRTELPREFEQMSFSTGIEAWMRAVYACNQYVDDQAPWALKRSDPARMKVVLLTLFMALRDLAIAIQPVVPTKAAILLDQLGIPQDQRGYADLEDADWYVRLVDAGFAVGAPVPVFPRLELPEEDAA